MAAYTPPTQPFSPGPSAASASESITYESENVVYVGFDYNLNRAD